MKKSAKKKPAKRPLSKKRQLAVAIAKDVIKQIKARRLRIGNAGYYVNGEIPPNCGIQVGDQVQEHIPLLRRKCDVCAKGAIFLSYVELKNQVTFLPENFHDRCGDPAHRIVDFDGADICENLGGAFSRESLDLIEMAFERCNLWLSDKSKAAYDLGSRYKTPGKRMIAICENIIENKGVFKP